MSEVRDDVVEVLKVLPDEAVDPTVLWDCLEGAVGSLVSRWGHRQCRGLCTEEPLAEECVSHHHGRCGQH